MKTLPPPIFIFVIFMMFYSCSKNNNFINEKETREQKLLILNKFEPNSATVSTLFSNFKKEYLLYQSDLKSGVAPTDLRVDEAVWLMEALVNQQYGFKADSIEYTVFDTTEIELTHKYFDTDGTPVIDGNEIQDELANLTESIELNNSNDYLFWATRIEIVGINETETALLLININGPLGGQNGFFIPKSPGTYIPPFPDGTSAIAGCESVYLCGAEDLFYGKICAPGPVMFGSNYVATYQYSFYKSAYIGPGMAEDRIFWDFGICESYTMNTAQLNQYLYSSKDVIDENNPIVIPELHLFIGFFSFNSLNVYSPTGTPYPGGQLTYNHWFEHFITFQIYKLTEINSEEE